MEQLLSLHLQKFNNRVKVLNQTNAKELVLTAGEARQLQADIFDLLIQIQALTEVRVNEANDVIVVEMKGDKF